MTTDDKYFASRPVGIPEETLQMAVLTAVDNRNLVAPLGHRGQVWLSEEARRYQ